MKIILKAEVDNLGLPGDIVTVADGYGRNYLIPRGMAILATKGAEREAQALLRARRTREAATLGDAEAQKAELESRTMIIGARVDERGTLYGSVGAADVEKVLRERGHRIPRKRIELKGVKEIGEYEVPVQVHPQVMATITVEVVDESGEVTLESLAAPTPEEVERAALDAATDATEGLGDTDTDVEALAEQALEAARAFEAEQAAEGEAVEATDLEQEAAEVEVEPAEVEPAEG
jgi:large subunit ribosomal protein L9